MPSRPVQSVRTKPPFDVDALWAIKRVGAPTLAPDGRLACAAVTSYSIDRNEGSTELWLYPTGFGARGQKAVKARRLTGGEKDSDPRWSPDGSRIAFAFFSRDSMSTN